MRDHLFFVAVEESVVVVDVQHVRVLLLHFRSAVQTSSRVMHHLVLEIADSRLVQEVVATVLSVEGVVKLAALFMGEV